MTYPIEVAREVAARRPDLDNDALRTALTVDDSLTADEAIGLLDYAAYEAAFDRAHEILSDRVRYECNDFLRSEWPKRITDALNDTWAEGLTVDQWVALVWRRVG